MKRMQGFLITAVACALALCARAEAMPKTAQALVPAQATITDDQTVGGLRVLTMELPSAKRWIWRGICTRTRPYS